MNLLAWNNHTVRKYLDSNSVWFEGVSNDLK